MNLCCRLLVSAALVAGGIVLTGCGQPVGTPSSVSSAAVTPIDEPGAADAQPVVPVATPPRPKAVETPVQARPTVTAEQPEVTPPLDLSLPSQIDLGSMEVKALKPKRLLPDLFDTQPEGERALSLRGRLLMNETDREDLDAIQGGEITMELKTR